jgi:hypothetical protein
LTVPLELPYQEERAMTLEQIRSAKRTRPFRRFTIHLDDGRAYQVKHPDLIAVSPNGREATFFDEDGGQHMLDLDHSTEVYVPPLAAAVQQAEKTMG